MPKATFSTRVSIDLLNKARDAVAQHQGPPLHLTLVKLAEGALRREVASAERSGEIPRRPKGAQAGIRGRRKREPGARQPPRRQVFSARVDLDLREKWRDLAYMRREELELAELFEKGLRKELKALQRKHGPIEERPASEETLRPGRRVK